MLYPIMNRSRSLIDLGGVWQFQLGDETEPEDLWSGPQEMDLIAVPASYNDQKDDPSTVGLITSEPWNSRHFCAEATDSVRYCVLMP